MKHSPDNIFQAKFGRFSHKKIMIQLYWKSQK